MRDDMGTTGTPGRFGADVVIDDSDQDTPTGSAVGAKNVHTTGGELVDPAMPYDRRPQSDDPVRRGPAS